MTIRIFAAILFLLANITQLYAQNNKPILVGVDGKYPPFSNVDIDGVLIGLDIELSMAICKKIKRTCNFVRYPWEDQLTALRAKKVDIVVAAVEINDQRRKLVDFSNPYLQIPSMIAVRKDTILLGVKNEDLQGAVLGVINSSTHALYAKTHLIQAKTKSYEQESDYFLDLANGQLDGIVGNAIIIDEWLTTPEGNNCCKMLGSLPYDNQINGEGFGIGVRKGEEKLLLKINGALRKLRESGKLKKIIHRNLPFLK